MGLLSYLQDDPLKQEALRRGLLGAGFAMMQSQNPKFLGVLGQGGAVGVPTYLDYLSRMKAANAAYGKPTYKTIKEATPAQYRYKLGDWSYSMDSQGNPIDMKYMKEQSDINKWYNENELEKARKSATGGVETAPLLDFSAKNIQQLSGNMPIFPIYGEEAISKWDPSTGFLTEQINPEEYSPSLLNEYRGSMPQMMLREPSAESINQGSIVYRTKTPEELASELEAYSRSLNRQSGIPYEAVSQGQQSMPSQAGGMSRQQEIPGVYGGQTDLPQMPVQDMGTNQQIRAIGEKKIIPGMSTYVQGNGMSRQQEVGSIYDGEPDLPRTGVMPFVRKANIPGVSLPGVGGQKSIPNDMRSFGQPQQAQRQYGSIGIPEGISQRVTEAGAPQMPTDIKGEVVQAASPAQVEMTPGEWSWEKYIEAIAKDPMHPNHEWAMKWYLEQQKANRETIPSDVKTFEYLMSLPEEKRQQWFSLMGKTANTPSNIIEWEYFSKLPKEQQEVYLEMKRNPQILNYGSEFRKPIPGTTETQQVGPKIQPKPEEMPSFKYDQELAKQRAQFESRLAEEQPSAFARMLGNDSKLKTIKFFAERAKGQANNWTTGLMGQALGGLGGTPQHNLAATLATVKANLGFEELQQMRMESPTGGALGQVAVQEINFLQSVLGVLEQSQSAEQLKENLDYVIRAKEESNARIRQAYENIYGANRQNPQSGRQPNVRQPDIKDNW